jgi:hypothetical protein
MLKAEATQRQHHASSSIAADNVRSQENWKHCHSHTKQGIFQTFHHLDYLRLTNVIAFVNSKKYNLKVLDNGATTFGRRPYTSKQGCGMTPASAQYKPAEIMAHAQTVGSLMSLRIAQLLREPSRDKTG